MRGPGKPEAPGLGGAGCSQDGNAGWVKISKLCVSVYCVFFFQCVILWVGQSWLATMGWVGADVKNP